MPFEEIFQIRNTMHQHNVILHKLWMRSQMWHPPAASWWIGKGGSTQDDVNPVCTTDALITPYSRGNPIEEIHIVLPNTQEVKVTGTATSINAISGSENIIHYNNLSDHWVDVHMQKRVWLASGTPSWGPWFYEIDWRSYETNPYDGAPDHIKNQYSPWPPQDVPEKREYRIWECEHFTGRSPGSINFNNINDPDDVYRTSLAGLKETASYAVKGVWSGYTYAQDNLNDFIHD